MRKISYEQLENDLSEIERLGGGPNDLKRYASSNGYSIEIKTPSPGVKSKTKNDLGGRAAYADLPGKILGGLKSIATDVVSIPGNILEGESEYFAKQQNIPVSKYNKNNPLKFLPRTQHTGIGKLSRFIGSEIPSFVVPGGSGNALNQLYSQADKLIPVLSKKAPKILIKPAVQEFIKGASSGGTLKLLETGSPTEALKGALEIGGGGAAIKSVSGKIGSVLFKSANKKSISTFPKNVVVNEKPMPEFAGNIRLSKYPESVAKTLSNLEEKNSNIFKKISVSNKTIRDMSREDFNTVDGIFKAPEGALASDSLRLRSRLADEVISMGDDIDDVLLSAGKVRRTTSEVARATQQHKIPIESYDKAINILEDRIDKEKDPILKQKLSEIASAVTGGRRSFNPDAWDKFLEFATAIKLTSPMTFLRNGVGNTMAALIRPIEKTAAGVFDAFGSSLSKSPRSNYVGEGAADLVGMIHGLKLGTKKAINALWNENYASSQQQIVQDALKNTKSISGLKGRVIRFPFRILNAMDLFAREIRDSGELTSAAYRKGVSEGNTGLKLAKRIDDLLKDSSFSSKQSERVAKLTDEYVFQQELDKYFSRLNKVRDIPVVRLIIPFFKTPINLAKFSFQRSPLGIVSPRNIEDILKGGEYRNEALARVTVGSLLTAPLALYAWNDGITGEGPKDRSERDILYASGWKPYSIRIGNEYKSYRGFEPLSSILSGVAAITENFKYKKEAPTEDKVVSVISATVKNLTNQPFLTGLRDVLDALEEPEKKSGKFISNLIAGSTIPTGVRYSEGLLSGGKIREPEGILETMLSRIPGLSENVPQRLNLLGEPISNKSIRIGENKVASELSRLKISPSLPRSFTIKYSDGERKNFTREQKNKLLFERGSILKDILGNTIKDPSYKSLDDETKSKILEDIIKDISSSSRISFLGRNRLNVPSR